MGKPGAAGLSAVAGGALAAGGSLAGLGLAGAPAGFISLATLRLLSLKIMSRPSSPVSRTSSTSSRSGASPNRRVSTRIDFHATTGSPVVASITFTPLTSAEPVYVIVARSRPPR